METILYATAGGLAFIWLCVHTFVGGREIARPLLEANELRADVRHTQYLCWHFTTATIACIAAFFGIAVFSGAKAFALSGTILSFSFFIVGVGLVLALDESHKRLPQGWLFMPVAGLGLAGLLA